MPETDKRLRILERQRLQQHTVYHAEDCRVGADPRGERYHRDDGEQGRTGKPSQDISQLLPVGLHGITYER
jgi:hypothetical protein